MAVQVEIGGEYGRLTLIGMDSPAKSGHPRYLCSCSCGGRKSVSIYSIASGKTQSCGCLHKEQLANRNRSHNMCGTGTYRTWNVMKSRCTNKNFPKYESYGARGIRICDKWMTFEGFIEDMGERPAGMSIDRIDVDGDYCKENCRWATASQQQRNKTNTRYITAFGRTQCLADWADETGIDHRTIGTRLTRGWSPERSVTP